MTNPSPIQALITRLEEVVKTFEDDPVAQAVPKLVSEARADVDQAKKDKTVDAVALAAGRIDLAGAKALEGIIFRAGSEGLKVKLARSLLDNGDISQRQHDQRVAVAESASTEHRQPIGAIRTLQDDVEAVMLSAVEQGAKRPSPLELGRSRSGPALAC